MPAGIATPGAVIGVLGRSDVTLGEGARPT
jgi:hypothetical protein